MAKMKVRWNRGTVREVVVEVHSMETMGSTLIFKDREGRATLVIREDSLLDAQVADDNG